MSTPPPPLSGGCMRQNNKERAGIRWDNVVKKIWRDLGGDQEEVMSIEQFGRYKTEVKERRDERER